MKAKNIEKMEKKFVRGVKWDLVQSEIGIDISKSQEEMLRSHFRLMNAELALDNYLKESNKSKRLELKPEIFNDESFVSSFVEKYLVHDIPHWGPRVQNLILSLWIELKEKRKGTSSMKSHISPFYKKEKPLEKYINKIEIELSKGLSPTRYEVPIGEERINQLVKALKILFPKLVEVLNCNLPYELQILEMSEISYKEREQSREEISSLKKK